MHHRGRGGFERRWRCKQRKVVFDHSEDAAAWLRERRDLQERHETRLEICEWAILIFVVLSVIVEGRAFSGWKIDARLETH